MDLAAPAPRSPSMRAFSKGDSRTVSFEDMVFVRPLRGSWPQVARRREFLRRLDNSQNSGVLDPVYHVPAFVVNHTTSPSLRIFKCCEMWTRLLPSSSDRSVG